MAIFALIYFTMKSHTTIACRFPNIIKQGGVINETEQNKT